MPTDLLLPLFSKQGLAVIKLANLLLTYRQGDRIEPVQQYAEKFETGVGTVQSALSYLQEIGAVDLDSRGHLGTFIQAINYPLIWALTGQDYVVGGMPLPYSRRYEGLATGLYEAFTQAEVALNLVYTRGSLNRLRALAHNKLDFVVLSRFAFNNAVQHGLAIDEALGLGGESYVGEHVLLFRDETKSGIENGMRIGIDPSSLDQSLLAKEACRGREVEFVDFSYMNLVAALEKGQIDATVWNSDDFSNLSQTFKATPLAETPALTAAKENTEAVIAVEHGNQLMLQILRSIIRKETICDIQAQVMQKKLLPYY